MDEKKRSALDFLDIWLKTQTELTVERRWKHHLVKKPNLREQNELQHGTSLAFLMNWVLTQLNIFFLCNREMLIQACLVSGWANGELKRSIDVIHRTPKHDLEDFQAFHARFSHLDSLTYAFFRRAFLLQFVLNEDWSFFPADVQSVLFELKNNHSLESLLFQFVRGVDYFYYGVEQLRDRGDAGVLKEVLANTLETMNTLANRIPGAKQVLWNDLRVKCVQMAETGRFIA